MRELDKLKTFGHFEIKNAFERKLLFFEKNPSYQQTAIHYGDCSQI